MIVLVKDSNGNVVIEKESVRKKLLRLCVRDDDSSDEQKYTALSRVFVPYH